MWKKVENTRKEINEAGKAIALGTYKSEEERAHYLQIIDSWRAAHAFPMNTFAINLKHRVERIDGAIVVQRLKRLDTIIGKLRRFPEMELYRMQDLGGCRVILPTVSDVYQLVKELNDSRIRHIKCPSKDYIAIPNPNTGYRSYHMIYKYHSDKCQSYEGLRVEIQIRTKLQHLWATTVETVGLFTDNGLKFNQGSDKWIKFFKYVSAFFAIEENTAIVEGVPSSLLRLYKEFFDIERELDAMKKLLTIGAATVLIGHVDKRKKPQMGYYLLLMDLKNLKLRVRIFSGVEKGLDEAIKAYNEFEKDKDKTMDAVLVSAQSYEALVTAYPNYFNNITAFTDKICKIINDGSEYINKIKQKRFSEL